MRAPFLFRHPALCALILAGVLSSAPSVRGTEVSSGAETPTTRALFEREPNPEREPNATDSLDAEDLEIEPGASLYVDPERGLVAFAPEYRRWFGDDRRAPHP